VTAPDQPKSLQHLHRFALIGLLAFRTLAFAGGATAIVLGFVLREGQRGEGVQPVTLGSILLTLATSFGVPLLLPAPWLRDRRLIPVLLVLAIVWFLPTIRGGDSAYGWLLRAFATGVAIAIMVIWDVFYGLARQRP
jgi:hypothetical protein